MVPYWIIDAFADRPFGGNPAAVVIRDRCPDGAWMQAVAGEFQLSETAFCWPASGGWGLRWFTPVCEVDLCGHATLACAATLWQSGRVTAAAIAFSTRSGALQARALDAAWRRIQIDLPSAPCTAIADAGDELGEILGARVCWVGGNQFDWLVELDDAEAVAQLQPDAGRIAGLPPRGIIITAQGTPALGCDVVSRFFAPRAGITEDAVTGSAHCALAPYWSRRLGLRTLDCRQLSRRGGRLEVELAGARVLIRGSAVMVAHGNLLVGGP